MMKYAILIWACLCTAGCSRSGSSADNAPAPTPRTAVTLTRIGFGNIHNDLSLNATTVYQDKTVMSAPSAGFITKVCVEPGMTVKAGQPLYYLESQEQHALSSPASSAMVIRAAQTGIVISVAAQAGSFVGEGTLLCTLALPGSLVFEIHVPYEQLREVSRGKRCTLVLPDGSRLEATIQTPLVTMDEASQSQRIVARARAAFLPEGMNVEALVPTEEEPDRKVMLLPRSAVQSDERLENYWVMKLSADSTAKRVPVTIGNSDADSIAIFSTDLSAADRIIQSGGYALEDGSRVTLSQPEKN
ncbi:MAG: HlyD family efflux transporter periplasmic adaptor subunit [Paraprevotella sp.]|nr:HlyD family efflux transporter periplasmic adaptor subunit [Paraprevotella sp.]